MAWFKKTLEDMKAAVDANDWDEVKKIRDQHKGDLDVESHLVEQNISEIWNNLQTYGKALSQIGILTGRKNPNKSDVKQQINMAISAATYFEETIKHHIALDRFIEKKMR
jgi:hypothetical protein